ncbi:ribosomal RNA small subunit methyltransferase NEP1 [Trifolium repens]|nr:ribosomal RNA small subunit methyltransferase NEP1 [Trifolium repens]
MRPECEPLCVSARHCSNNPLDSLNSNMRTFRILPPLKMELLQKLSISATGKREKLLRTLKNPTVLLSTIPSNLDLVFVVGAMAHGKIETDYTEDYIAVSGYPLSAAYCIARICNSIEGKWNIL